MLIVDKLWGKMCESLRMIGPLFIVLPHTPPC